MCKPGVRLLVENEAWPLALSVTGVCGTPSIVKTTLPVGVGPLPVELTVAVNVTVLPNTDGLSEDTSVVPVLAGLTVNNRPADIGLVL